MIPALAIVQASSRSWAGGADDCLSLVGGVPAVRRTLDVVARALPGVPRAVVAPSFDATGPLAEIAAEAGVPLVAGHDASPLRRLVAAAAALAPGAWVLRLDGVAMFVDPRTIREMCDAVAADWRLDCYKTADDYPALLSVDLYRARALRNALAMLPAEDGWHVHPKFFMAQHEAFRVARHPAVVRWTDDELRTFRARARELYRLEHGTDDPSRAVAAGDQLGFHYARAAARIGAGATVLDVACGAGFGAARLASHAGRVLAGDLDADAVARAARRFAAPNVEFRTMDATATGLADDAVDCVTSFETIEHTCAGDYLAEMNRVLRPGGLFFLSTPQSCHGRVPINPWHEVEYGREDLLALVGRHFDVLEFTGLKQGTIALDGDPVGQNSYLVMRSRKEERA